MRFAIGIALAVRLVMLVVVADEVAQREPVVRGNEVDRGGRPTSARFEDVARPGQATGELRHQTAIAFPVRAHGVAVAAVPIGPAGRKSSHLVATITQVPRLRDQLDLR